MKKLKYKTKIARCIAIFLLINILSQVIYPTLSYALTTGPSQPEIQSFEPVGTTEMVDLFTGDFTYNIPLFELPGPNGGYPFNLFYNSGITMDQEASWVGLGWNLNPGAIHRQMRGLPDEFNGQSKVTKEMDIRDNVTIGGNSGASVEFYGGVAINGGLGIYYNNYKGIGYSLETGLSMSMSSSKSGIGGGVGFGVKLDSQEGVGVDASVSLSDVNSSNSNTFNFGIGYNSRSGLSSITLGYDYSKHYKDPDNQTLHPQRTIGESATISFFSGGYSPQVSLPMQGRNVSMLFKMGLGVGGTFINLYGSGFFSTQYLKDKNQPISKSAYGYLNAHNASDQDLLDFNREKDGVIRKTSPNLPIPVTTPDIYTVNAQGIGGMFRAYRNDNTKLFDHKVRSTTAGGSLGADLGPGLSPHFGVNLSINHSTSESGLWDDNNETQFGITPTQNSSLDFEPSYFKMYGEHTADLKEAMNRILNSDAARVELGNGSEAIPNAKNTLERPIPNGREYNTYDASDFSSREPRNTVISYINNDQSKGIVATNPDGTRYFYCKKAMNTKHVECTFTCGPVDDLCNPFKVIDDGDSPDKPRYNYPYTEQYYNRTSIDPYAYTYLLTHIVGPDYVDIDKDGKPSDADYGYWVKFEYGYNGAEEDAVYRWRAPFTKANVIQGLYSTAEDNKATYMYGEKKIQYLKSAETKTHIAIFETSFRPDARGAYDQLQKGQTMDAYTKQLDKITLKAKNDPSIPIKTVHFKYNHNLCKGVENNADAANSGKLTLEKVWFTYENNNRGRLNPYIFSYNESITAENPNYRTFGSDRWGNYRISSTNQCKDIDFPYVRQFDNSNPDFKKDADDAMGAWNLKKITLPSGGSLEINYESDDYAYVQNKRAMQMFEIESLSEGNSINPYIYPEKWADKEYRRVFFKLQEETTEASDIDEYVKGIDKLYFKVYMYLRTTDEPVGDFVSGYVDVDGYGMDEKSKTSDGKYTRGYITLGRATIGMKNGSHRDIPYHAFSAAGFQYLRTMRPQLTSTGRYDVDPNSSAAGALDKIKSLTSTIFEVRKIFEGFNLFCWKNNWCQKIELNRSFIRLNNPIQKKLGGGCRVKQITLKDNWDLSTSSEKENVYGQVYNYTLEEKSGNKTRVISSGVAAYEPMIGGDENPLRQVKEYAEAIPLKTNNNLYFELPINESYYPAPGVGYRKVTVRSLATAQAGKTGSENPFGLPAGIHGNGAQVHEFYTAKEFPVITNETSINLDPYNLYIPIPLIGQITVNNLVGSQGYSIVLNDMHGKLKKVSNYRQDKQGNIQYASPVNSVEYFYNTTQHKVDASPVNDYYELNSELNVLYNSGNNYDKKLMTLGQDYEIFTDMRKNRTEAYTGGLALNVDVLIFGFFVIPVVAPWPTIGSMTNDVRTIVTNKIVTRAGILVATEVYTEGSLVRTDNLVFNETGEPVVTRVTNNYNDPIYNFSMPAYFMYDGMGQAYRNVGFTFNGSLVLNASSNLYLFSLSSSSSTADLTKLVPGDEFLVNGSTVIFVKKDAGGYWFTASGAITDKSFTLVRSGRRNLLTAKAGSLTTLGDKAHLDDKNYGYPLPYLIY